MPASYCSSVGSRALCEQVGENLNSSAGYTLLVDYRNDPIRPTRGWTGNLRQDLAGIGGDGGHIRSSARPAVRRPASLEMGHAVVTDTNHGRSV